MKVFEEVRPSVFIYCESLDLCALALRGIKEGLEEEEVLYKVMVMPGDAETLAVNAARTSRLGIGIGLSADGTCVLQHKCLRMGRPIFRVFAGACYDGCYRLVGSHAARLVKNLPLKEGEYGTTGLRSY